MQDLKLELLTDDIPVEPAPPTVPATESQLRESGLQASETDEDSWPVSALCFHSCVSFRRLPVECQGL